MTGKTNNDNPNQIENLPKRSECQCACHHPGSNINHQTPCCTPDVNSTKGKDGKDYF